MMPNGFGYRHGQADSIRQFLVPSRQRLSAKAEYGSRLKRQLHYVSQPKFSEANAVYQADWCLRFMIPLSTRTVENAQSEEQKGIEKQLKKLEHQFAITPQRMRKIVDGFIDVLEQGLEKAGEMVVCVTCNPTALCT
jgi:CRISPR/Cas system CSM-associated protein Csm2 small subunit